VAVLAALMQVVLLELLIQVVVAAGVVPALQAVQAVLAS
jgi:hypothetical protein